MVCFVASFALLAQGPRTAPERDHTQQIAGDIDATRWGDTWSAISASSRAGPTSCGNTCAA
eukprot:1715334-Prorocentrum_lima.AAC.1